MNINYDELKQDLENTKHVNSLPERERIISKISATALVDIAETLSQLLQLSAVEAATVTLENTFEPAVDEPATNERPLEVGDLVTIGDTKHPAVIKSMTESEGNLAALVEWSDETTAKVWLDELTSYRIEPFAFVDPDPAFDDVGDGDAYAVLAAARKRAARS